MDQNVVILLIVVGAAGLIAMGYGMHRALATRVLKSGWDRQFNQRNPEQDQYMIDVRMAHRNALMAELNQGSRGKRHESPLPY